MRQLRYILFIIVIVKFDNVLSQKLEGIYFSEYRSEMFVEVQPMDSLQKRPIKIDWSLADTTYTQYFIILDFHNDTNVTIKYLYTPAIKATYKLKRNKIEIKSSEVNYSGIINKKEELVLIENESYNVLKETFFKPIISSSIIESELPNPNVFLETFWEIHEGKDLASPKQYYHIFDTNYAILTTIRDDYIQTNFIEVFYEKYKNHFFIGLLNYRLNAYQVFHITDILDDRFCASYLDFSDRTMLPDRLEVDLVKTKLNKDLYDSLKGKLIGEWKTNESVIPLDYHYRNDSLTSQELLFEFRQDGSFKIERSAIMTKGDESIPLYDTIIGTWKLSDNLKCIELMNGEVYDNFITLKLISDKKAIVNMDIKSINGRVFSQETFEITKITGHNKKYT